MPIFVEKSPPYRTVWAVRMTAVPGPELDELVRFITPIRSAVEAIVDPQGIRVTGEDGCCFEVFDGDWILQSGPTSTHQWPTRCLPTSSGKCE